MFLKHEKQIEKYFMDHFHGLTKLTAGFLTIITEKPFTPRHEYILILIIGGFACVLVLGGISALVYLAFKILQSLDPFKRALQVYTFFIFAMILVNGFRFPGAIKERDRHEFLTGFRQSFDDLFTAKIAAEPNALPPEVTGHKDEICACFYYGLEGNEVLLDSLMEAKDPKEFAINSPAMKQLSSGCFELYMKY